MAMHGHPPSTVGSLRNVRGIIFPKPEDPPDPSLVRSGLTPAQAYQAQINLHSVSPPLPQNGRLCVSVDDVPRIGVQIESDLNIDFGLDDHPESRLGPLFRSTPATATVTTSDDQAHLQKAETQLAIIHLRDGAPKI